MTDVSGQATTGVTWEELAREEIVASRVGGVRWDEFVAYAEKVTGRPWARIRELIDPYVAAELKRQGLT